LNQEPARAVHTQACATRDILSRWRTAHIHVRRPSGVLLSSRAHGLAALDGLRGFRLAEPLRSLRAKANPPRRWIDPASGLRKARAPFYKVGDDSRSPSYPYPYRGNTYTRVHVQAHTQVRIPNPGP